jgi:hypothetical protein
MGKRLTTEEFIKRAKKIHGNKYDYSFVIYEGANQKIKIKCEMHGIWEVPPKNHIKGNGCPRCARIRAGKILRQTKEEFIEKAKKKYGDKYDYSEMDYIDSYTKKVKIKCIYHNSFFYQLPREHIYKYGCPICGMENRKEKSPFSFEQFLLRAQEVHGKDKYIYNKNSFKNTRAKMDIECKKHGIFTQRASSHLSGVGCPHCLLKNEGKVKELLLKYFSDWVIIVHKKIWDKYKDYHHKRYCDFFLKKGKKKIIVEYDGKQHFEPINFGCKNKNKVIEIFKKTQIKDLLDIQFCKENNIILHRIKYNDNKEESIIQLKNKVVKA